MEWILYVVFLSAGCSQEDYYQSKCSGEHIERVVLYELQTCQDLELKIRRLANVVVEPCKLRPGYKLRKGRIQPHKQEKATSYY